MTGGWLRDPRYDAGLEELAALQRERAALEARQAVVLAQLAAHTSREGWQGDAPWQSLLLDVAGTCVLGQVAAGNRLVDAEHLVARLPRILQALAEGRLTAHQVQVLVEQTRPLSPAPCDEVERRCLEQAPSLCPADLRRLLRRTVLELDADVEVRRREERARAQRRTWVTPADDGMAVFSALLPAEQAQAVQRGLTGAKRAGDPRPVDQRRADALVALAVPDSSSDAGGVRVPVRVVVHVPVDSALGTSDTAAELEGVGSISAGRARRLPDGAELTRACVSPRTGRVWALDEPRTGRRVDGGRAGGGAPPGVQVERRRALHAALLALRDLSPPVPLPPEPRHDPSRGLAAVVRARDQQLRRPGLLARDGPLRARPRPPVARGRDEPAEPRGAVEAVPPRQARGVDRRARAGGDDVDESRRASLRRAVAGGPAAGRAVALTRCAAPDCPGQGGHPGRRPPRDPGQHLGGAGRRGRRAGPRSLLTPRTSARQP